MQNLDKNNVPESMYGVLLLLSAAALFVMFCKVVSHGMNLTNSIPFFTFSLLQLLSFSLYQMPD